MAFKPPGSGDLNHRVTTLTKTKTEDRFGGERESWQADGSSMMRVLPLGGREDEKGGRQSHLESFQLTRRYTKNITAKNRLQLRDGTVLQITGSYDPQMPRPRTWLVFEAIEIKA